MYSVSGSQVDLVLDEVPREYVVKQSTRLSALLWHRNGSRGGKGARHCRSRTQDSKARLLE